MAQLSFRDRFYTPRVANAVTSPSGILAFGAGAAIGIIVLGPVGVVAGVLAYGARVAMAVPRNPKDPSVDPRAVGEPWRSSVQQALDARRRYTRAVDTVRPGPLRENLQAIGGRLDDAVQETWRVAQRGQLVTEARAQIDVDGIQQELAAVRGGSGGRPAPDDTVTKTAQALQAQLDSAARLDGVIADTRNRLMLLDARLDEAITRTIELSVQADSGAALDPSVADVDGIVGEMESVRQALEATSAAERGLPT